MQLYIVQHGAALSKEQDSSRPLSEQGRTDVQTVGRYLPGSELGACEFLHSGKLRAWQTADVLAEAVGTFATEAEGLGPKDPLEPWLERISGASGGTVLVGHQPFVGRLATQLLAGREEPAVVAFEPGAVVALERQGAGWAVRWMLAPALLRSHQAG